MANFNQRTFGRLDVLWEILVPILILGKLATIGISRSYVDNSDLEFSAIGRMKCTPPGTTDSTLVDPDLIFGLVRIQSNYSL